MAELARTQCAASARLLRSLVKSLPESVPLASAESKICQIFQKVSVPHPTADGEEHWAVFNRRMDLLFGNDVHDKDGKLLNITRGQFGMDLVVHYAQEAVDTGHLLWEAALPKFARLVTALQDARKVLPITC